MKTIDAIIAELNKFSPDMVTFHEPAHESNIRKFEEKYDIILPDDYKSLLSKTNGFDLMGDNIYGLFFEEGIEDLDSVYHFEHFEVTFPQFKYLVPFSPDGAGNFYCFDTIKSSTDGKSCQIVFWASNYEYSDTDLPEITNDSFAEFVQEYIIGWTLEDYDYEGNPVE